jgi:hypothetical protein
VNTHPDKTEENWQEEAEAFWEETPTVLRTVYIAIAVLLVLIILCCAFFFCFGLPCERRKDYEEKLEKRSIVQEQAPPMMMRRANSQIPVSPVHVKEDDEDEDVLLPLSPHKGKENLRQGTGASRRRSTGEPQNSRQGVGTKSPKPGLRRQSSEPQNSKQGVGTKSPKPGRRRQSMGEPQNSRQGVGTKLPKPGCRRQSNGGPNTNAGGIMGEPQNLRQGTGASRRRSTGEPQNSKQGVSSKPPKSLPFQTDS